MLCKRRRQCGGGKTGSIVNKQKFIQWDNEEGKTGEVYPLAFNVSDNFPNFVSPFLLYFSLSLSLALCVPCFLFLFSRPVSFFSGLPVGNHGISEVSFHPLFVNMQRLLIIRLDIFCKCVSVWDKPITFFLRYYPLSIYSHFRHVFFTFFVFVFSLLLLWEKS